MRELQITPQQAAGIVGNFGQESGLISGRQEGTKASDGPYPILGHKGGIDWAQWTADRRRHFAQWVEEREMTYPSYEASLGFVLHELRGLEAKALRQLRLTKTAKAAAETFEHLYERAGVKAWPQRVAFAERALKLWLASPYNTGEQPVPTTPVPVPTPLPDPAKPWYLSQTLWGIVVAMAAPLVAKAIPSFATVDQGTVVEWIVWVIGNIVPLLGGAAAIQGRLSATKPIAGTNAEKVAEAALEKAIEVPSPTYQPPIEAEIAEAVRGIRPETRLVDMSLETLVEQLPEVFERFRRLRQEIDAADPDFEPKKEALHA
jgi:hypothetical protein